MQKVAVTVNLNGMQRDFEIEARTLLSELIREQAGLTGTHIGCDTSSCGACTVLLDGLAVKSCTLLAASADGGSIVTIEGLAIGGQLHPLQAAFREEHGLQCGFCTPGFIMAAADLLAKRPDASEDEVRQWLKGNLCRCTGYHNIVKAVLSAAARLRAEGSGAGAANEPAPAGRG